MDKFAVGMILGIVVGSAVNALTYRWPKGLSMWEPKRSFCPFCKKTLTFYELIPLISFLIQKGKCRGCHSKISWRYPLGELGHGILWGTCTLHFNDQQILGWFCFISLCWTIFWTDIENFWIPDEIGALLFFLGIMINGTQGLLGAGIGLCLVAAMGLIGLIFLKQDSIGHGDLKLMRGIGACLLLNKIFITFILAVFGGAFVGIIVKSINTTTQQKPLESSPPETLSSYLKCFLGYLVGIDILALFLPKLGKKWFGSDNQTEAYNLPATALPFGSFLILGAYGSLFFQPQLEGYWHKYLEWIGKS